MAWGLIVHGPDAQKASRFEGLRGFGFRKCRVEGLGFRSLGLQGFRGLGSSI